MREYKRVAENLFIREKTGRYYAIINKNKRRTTQSLKTTIRAVANARLYDLKSKLGAATSNPKQKEIPLLATAILQVIETVKRTAKAKKMSVNTSNGIEWHLNLIAKSHLGAIQINRVRAQSIKEYLDKRHLDCSGRTANVDMTHLRRVFSLAIEQGWRWDNPLSELKSYEHITKKIRVPDPEELRSHLINV